MGTPHKHLQRLHMPASQVLTTQPQTHQPVLPNTWRNEMIRKRRKACWEYECQPCHHLSTHVDQFRAIEASQKHQRSIAHAFSGVNEAIRNFAAVWTGAGSYSGNQSDYALIPDNTRGSR